MTTRRLLVDDRQPDGTSANDPIWRRLREIVRAINNSTMLPGRLITEDDGAEKNSGVAFVASSPNPKTIAHKLGRKAIGFVEIQGADLKSGNVGLAAAEFPKGMSSEHHISITPARDGRCFIWVF